MKDGEEESVYTHMQDSVHGAENRYGWELKCSLMGDEVHQLMHERGPHSLLSDSLA